MRITHSHGPFSERPFYKDKEIELTAADELRKVGLFPSSPQPIRVERFVEKRFSVTPIYEELPSGVLGFTRFGSGGVEGIVVSRSLGEEGSTVAERRVNTTLAHEAGHGLLHAHLFALEKFNRSLFDDEDASPGKILCRDTAIHSPTERRQYDGRWWEVQANKLMGALLLPRTLVTECVEPLLEMRGHLRVPGLPADRREEAARLLSEVFDVNPVVGRIRLAQMYPEVGEQQLTL